jgi:DNA-directed RNA polymerase subunit RPC12/RpoP
MSKRKKSYQCFVCKKTFSTMHGMRIHRGQSHKAEVRQFGLEDDSPLPADKTVEPLCSTAVLAEAQLRNITCGLCGHTSDYTEMVAHALETHPKHAMSLPVSVPYAADRPRDLYQVAEADTVNQPSHYTSGDIECIDAIRAALTDDEWRGFIKGNVIKYIWRERLKNGNEDLKKAEKYLEFSRTK